MKKVFLFSVIIAFAMSVYGQNQTEYEYPIDDLIKFEQSKEKIYSKLNLADSTVTVLYQNGIYARICLRHFENENFASNTLQITYFVPDAKSLIKNVKDKKEILNFIKKEIAKNDFILDSYFFSAYDDVLNNLKKARKYDCLTGFMVWGANSEFESELAINVLELCPNQLTIAVSYKILMGSR